MTQAPGKEFTSFTVIFDKDYYSKNDIVRNTAPTKLKVVTDPKVSFWSVVGNILTFGWYPIKYKYKVETLHDTKS